MIAALATVTAPRGRIAPPACSFKTIVTRAITAGGGSVQLHRQADALARGIHLQHFDFHNLAGFHHLAGIFDKLVAHLAKHHQVITSMYAYSEAHRNNLGKRMSWLDNSMNLVAQIKTVTGMDKEIDVEIVPKDRPILATAIHEKCDFLVTGDKRDFGHLFNVEVRGVQIVTPGTMARIIAND